MMSEELLAELREHNSTGAATRPVYVRMLLDEIERLRAERAKVREPAPAKPGNDVWAKHGGGLVRVSDLRELAAAMAADDGWSDGDIRDVQLAAEEIERLRAELADIRKRRSVWPPVDDEDT